MRNIKNLEPEPETDDIETLGLAAILVKQNESRYYIVSMPSTYLSDTCFTVTREEDPIAGFQRRLNESRAEAIATYIDENNGSIPTAIILSAQVEANLEYSSKNKTLSFKKDNNAFLIIDGQHRVWGFSKATKSVRVPVVIFENLSRLEEAQLFIDINTNQQKVPDALLIDVKRLLENETEEEKRCSEVFERFFSKEDSILKEKLSRTEAQPGKISRKVFNSSIKDTLNNFLREVDEETAYKLFNSYIKSFINSLEKLEKGLKEYAFRPMIFQAILNISSNVFEKTVDKYDTLSFSNIQKVVEIIESNLKVETFKKNANSYKKNSEYLIESMNRRTVKPTIIIEE